MVPLWAHERTGQYATVVYVAHVAQDSGLRTRVDVARVWAVDWEFGTRADESEPERSNIDWGSACLSMASAVLAREF